MAEQHTIQVDIVSAEGEIFSGRAKMVFAAAIEGDLGIAPRHAPLLTLLKAGEVRVQPPDGAEQAFFVGGGALEVQPKKVTGLAAKQRAEEALRDRPGNITQAEALAELARTVALLKFAQKLRNPRG